ncbi:MAG: single-stranded-DNA-specific exonuclease RecJ [Cyanobacteria bacterium NC_groundwater_1444_Ag_S-0.65um_54_12]|nr:single-stranded-DNA-specific exonuclease RecJ [Cyanobacteria bacterium NC_groundwater_1444_Ag_S-0.65um_54_12]
MWQLRSADDRAVERLAAELALPRVVTRVLYLRGYRDAEAARSFISARDDLTLLAKPVCSPAMARAVSRIQQAIVNKERIGLYGDYDCDGVTSSAILYRYLKRGLAADIQPRLPDRFVDGYGIHPAAIAQFVERGCSLILTCDNGISALAAATRARELGVDLIVTDHHQIGDSLPEAYALVHPQIDFPQLADLCGAGVAFLLVIALEGQLSRRLESFLDLVALGTVGDVVPLTGPNRSLLWAGIQRIRRNLAHPGVKALVLDAKISPEQLTAHDLGFKLCPRLNAPGRIETPDSGFQLLITNDRKEAQVLADRLSGLNSERQELTKKLEAEVFETIETEWDLDSEPFVVLARSDFHHGVMGLIAGRAVERFQTPVLLLSANADGTWRGSGRSPESVHLYQALQACSDQLLGFGGHARAAGCRLAPEGIAALRAALNAYLIQQGWRRRSDVVWLDAELPFSESTPALLKALDLLEPHGSGHQPPAFGLLNARVVGTDQSKNERHLLLRLDDGEVIAVAWAWNKAQLGLQPGDWIRLTYHSRWNTYKGRTALQHVADLIERIEQPSPGSQKAERVVSSAASDQNEQTTRARLIDARPRNHESIWHDAADGSPEWSYAIDESPTVAVYAHGAPAGPGHWLRPPVTVPPGTTAIIVQDVPADSITWQQLVAAAEQVVMAWDDLDEAELAPATLESLYCYLAERRGLELFTAIAHAPAPLLEAQAAIRIFREAGLMVCQQGEWRLLAPPAGVISLPELAAYRRYRQDRSFRMRLATASVAEAYALLDARPASS